MAVATSTTLMSGSITVFAASSLTGAFNTAKTTLTGADPGLSLTYSFAGSNALVAQITQGAPADVFRAEAEVRRVTEELTTRAHAAEKRLKQARTIAAEQAKARARR